VPSGYARSYKNRHIAPCIYNQNLRVKKSLPRMAHASLSTATRSHLLPAGSSLPRIPALRDVPTSLQAKKTGAEAPVNTVG
jgi:hypothetical protein